MLKNGDLGVASTASFEVKLALIIVVSVKKSGNRFNE